MFKKLLLRQLSIQLAEAEELGCIKESEANALRKRAAGWDWVAIIKLIMLIADLIIEFLNQD